MRLGPCKALVFRGFFGGKQNLSCFFWFVLRQLLFGSFFLWFCVRAAGFSSLRFCRGLTRYRLKHLGLGGWGSGTETFGVLFSLLGLPLNTLSPKP